MTRRSRRGLLTRWEIALGLVLLAATAAWARPKILRATWRTRQAEAEMVLASLAEYEVGVQRSTGRYAPLGPFPRAEQAVDREAVGWRGAPAGWHPPLDVARCAYRAEGDRSVRLVATCDVDGNGEPSVTTLVPGEAAVRVTADEVW